ncbi:putative leader peptide [uncultured Jatrophihabitans sp.]
MQLNISRVIAASGRPSTVALVCRRHIDLQRVSGALCRPRA